MIQYEEMERKKVTPDVKDTEYGTVTYVEDDTPKWKFWAKRRYVVAILAFMGFFTSYILRVNLSIAIVSMVANRSKVNENGTTYYEQEFKWDPPLQGLILSSFFYGYICTQFAGGWLAARVGGKRVFGIGIGITAAFTVITPPIVRANVYLLVVVRIVEGICEGVTYPSVHAIWANWAPPLERSKLATIAFSGSFVGTVISMPVAGMMTEYLGWASVFYVFGAFGLCWLILWWIVVTDKPEDDPYISEIELKYIKESLGHSGPKEEVVYPWKKIFSSPPVWSIVAAHCSENWGFYTMLTQLPTYMSDVYNFRIDKTGFLSALPYLAMSIILLGSGQLADYLRTKEILTTTQVRKIFNCGAFVCQTIFMTTAAFMTTATGAIFFITMAVGLGGFAWSGFSVNHLDIAPQHASVLMGIGNTFATIPGIVSPLLTGYIVSSGSAEDWRIIFFISSGVYLVGAIIYGLFASGERQSWAMEKKNDDLGHDNVAMEVDKL